MQNLAFPLQFKFHVTTLSNDFTATDANDQTIAYVKQKLFKFVEHVEIFKDKQKTELLFNIRANKWIDFSASYNITTSAGDSIGYVARKGWASIWKANYQVFLNDNQQQFTIQEENAWVKVGDALLNEVPILGIFTGYLFNPAYLVKDMQGNVVIKLKKQPSFFGRKFSVIKMGDFPVEKEALLLSSLMMLILLERRRG